MRYRKVSTRIWADDRFMRLSTPQPNAQSLFLYLLTGPHTTCIPGVIVAGEASLAEALGWPMEGFREAFRELLAEGSDDGHAHPLVMADLRSRLIFLPRAARHNQPENPNVVKSWKIQWSEVPECDLKVTVWNTLLLEISEKSSACGKEFQASIERPKGSGKPFVNPLPKPMANQEQEQEQEQEKNLALFAEQKVAEAPKRRGRPPKDQSPEAEAERVAEKADGERWITAARALIGLTAEEAPWSSATFMAFRRARKQRGVEQLMRALAGLEGDRWASSLGLAALLSAAVIEKGLAAGNRRANVVGTGFDAAWDNYAKEAGLV
jgi:hypothetical protein